MNSKAYFPGSFLLSLALTFGCAGDDDGSSGQSPGDGAGGTMEPSGGTNGSGGTDGTGSTSSGGQTGGGGAVGTGGIGGTGGIAGTGGGGGSGGGSEVQGAALYLSPTGDDANPGTFAEPLATLEKARDAVRDLSDSAAEDLRVVLRGGTYRIDSTVSFGPEDSGKNGHRIIYEAYPGETPILSGSTRVSGFTAHEGGVYKAPLTRATKLRNLYVNDRRASMTKKTVTAGGAHGTFSVSAGEADWAWAEGSVSDGVLYDAGAVPEIASNRDDLEIVNGTTWNENIVCVRDVITTGSNERALLLQQPYGAIAQLPGWGTAFIPTGTHTIYNAFEFLNEPGQYYFDKTEQTLYYYPREGEDMESAEVEVPVVEKIIEISGESTTDRVSNLTFTGITFAHSDFGLFDVEGSCGKATVQGATAFIAFRDGDWHNQKYEIIDTNPGMITVTSADSIHFLDNVIKHSGSDGLSMANDVVNAEIRGNYITDIAASGITIGHPQHVYEGDGGTHEKYAPGVEGVCTNIEISNNVLYDISTQPGFGGCAAITAFFVDTVSVTQNHIELTAYNGINLGWGWRNFQDSTTCKDNNVSNNRLIDTLSRLHDSGAIYTIGQMPGTTINENYVRGIPPATSGPTYGLHNDEGSAYITENDNVLDIDPGVHYTINCEDFGEKHNLTILRTYATVNKMGIDPPNSTIDPPIAVPDNVWPLPQYTTCVNSGLQAEYMHLLSSELVSLADYVFPASTFVDSGESTSIPIRSSGDPESSVWLAPAGTSTFEEGASMTRAAGDATAIAAPASTGEFQLHILDSAGALVSASEARLRVE